MGHNIHGRYTVDFTNPKHAWHSVVMMADSYSADTVGGPHQQTIDRVAFEEAEPVVFRLVGKTFKVTPETAIAASLFGV